MKQTADTFDPGPKRGQGTNDAVNEMDEKDNEERENGEKEKIDGEEEKSEEEEEESECEEISWEERCRQEIELCIYCGAPPPPPDNDAEEVFDYPLRQYILTRNFLLNPGNPATLNYVFESSPSPSEIAEEIAPVPAAAEPEPLAAAAEPAPVRSRSRFSWRKILRWFCCCGSRSNRVEPE